MDPVGVAASAGGLVVVTYGLIRAGEVGWSNVGALLTMIAGVALLASFFGWERRLTRRPSGQPLLDLTLFRSSSFTWGVILAAVPLLAMLGVLFTMPQYFQGVLGTNAMGSGLRLLPLIAGLVFGAAKVTLAAGFALLTAGLLVGATTTAGSGGLFAAARMAIAGAGTGAAITTASAAALGELTEEHSGVGSAVLQAVTKTGGPFGIAILGSVLSAGYLGRLNLSGLPATAAAAVRQSVFGGVAVAHQIRSASLLTSVQGAFIHGMDLALLVSAGIALAGVALTLLFLPASAPKALVMPPAIALEAAIRPRAADEGEVVATR
jgi:DHA2 family multidrug resistance protein-like MFS transporter